MRAVLYVIGLSMCLHAAPASACGHCVEDKIAAVYDYAVVTQAKARKHQVAFVAIDGAFVPNEALRSMIETTVQSTGGVDRESVHVSLEMAALSFSFDPMRTSLVLVQKSLGEKFSEKHLQFTELEFMDESAAVDTADRP